MSAPALFDQSDQVFAVGNRRQLHSMTLRLAERTVALHFASDSARSVIGRTFRHLQAIDTGEPDLVIRVWDPAGSGMPPPSLASADDETGAIHFTGAAQCIVDRATGRIEAYDPARRLGLLFVPDLASLDPGYAAAPLRTLLHWWAIEQGWLLLHAASVANEAGAALLVGRGGSGKSTTVLGCAGAAFDILGDDYCLYQPHVPGHVHSLFGSSKIDTPAIALMPHLAPAFVGAPLDPKGKRIIQVGDHFASLQRVSAPLRAIIVPRVGGGHGCVAKPITAAEALRALAPSTIFQLAGGRARALGLMARLVRTLPCWRMTIGSDPTLAREPIGDIIRSAARTA